jgi:hypothetical protein
VNLERLALARAEEQLVAGAWKRADRGEWLVKAPVTCMVPGCTNPITKGKGERKRCDSCRAKGLAATPCKGCGGVLKRSDQTSPREGRRGYCQTCRAGMPYERYRWPKGVSGNPGGHARRVA